MHHVVNSLKLSTTRDNHSLHTTDSKLWHLQQFLLLLWQYSRNRTVCWLGELESALKITTTCVKWGDDDRVEWINMQRTVCSVTTAMTDDTSERCWVWKFAAQCSQHHCCSHQPHLTETDSPAHQLHLHWQFTRHSVNLSHCYTSPAQCQQFSPQFTELIISADQNAVCVGSFSILSFRRPQDVFTGMNAGTQSINQWF